MTAAGEVQKLHCTNCIWPIKLSSKVQIWRSPLASAVCQHEAVSAGLLVRFYKDNPSSHATHFLVCTVESVHWHCKKEGMDSGICGKRTQHEIGRIIICLCFLILLNIYIGIYQSWAYLLFLVVFYKNASVQLWYSHLFKMYRYNTHTVARLKT